MIRFLKNTLLIFGIAFLLTSTITWPFVKKLPTFYYDRGDYQLSGATLAYNEYSLRTGRIFNREVYLNGFQYYPSSYTLAYSDPRLFPSLIYSPIYWITNHFVFSVNMVTFLSFVLSFMSSFYVINYFLKNKLASIIGATIYTFNPLTFSRFPEHFELLNKYFLPLVFLFAYKFFQKPTLKRATLFGTFFTLNALSAIYFQVMSLSLLPVFFAPFLYHHIGKGLTQYLYQIFKSGLIFLIFIPLIWYINSFYIEFSQQELTHRTLEENSYFSARLIDYFSPLNTSFLYKDISLKLDPFRAPKDNQGGFNYQEHTLFLNFIPLFLFGLFLIFFKKNRVDTTNYKLATIPFLLVLSISFLFTFGPFFNGWNSYQSGFKLPYYFLYNLLSFMQGIRAPTRFLFLFYVPFSFFTALGALLLFKFLKRNYLILPLTLIILAGLSLENFYLNGPLVSYDENSKVLSELENPDLRHKLAFLENKSTLHLPFFFPTPGLDSIYLNWSAVTREKTMTGNSGFFTSDQARFLTKIKIELNEEIFQELYLLNLDYIVVHKDLLKQYNLIYPIGLEKFASSIIFDQNNIQIFDLKRMGFNPKRCNFDSDFEISFRKASLNKTLQTVNLLLIKNKSDCYLPSIYQERYKKKNFQIANLFGNFYLQEVNFKLPPIIRPNEELLLSDLNNDFRIK